MTRSLPLAALPFVAAIAACGGDSTGPAPAASITVSVRNVSAPAIFQDQGATRVRCTMTFRARASGTGSATWLEGKFMFYAGADRTEPLDTLIISASEVRDAWGAGSLDAGDTVESDWWFEFGAPFDLEGEFWYLPAPGAAVKRAPVQIACGPRITANSSPPEITQLTLSSPPDGLEPGDTLFVTYTAVADAGLLATAVELTGACETYVEVSERLQATVTRTIPLEISRGCTLGAPLIVTVYAADAAVRVVQRAAAGPAVEDHTPPAITFLSTTTPPGYGTWVIRFAGDTIDLVVSAFDNYRLRSIVYELLPTGRRDSVSAVSNFAGPIRVPIPPDMAGPVQVRVWAHDFAGLMSPAVTTPSDALVVYPTVVRPTLTTMVDGGVRDMAIDVARGAVYIAPYNRRRITVLSATTLAVAREIELLYLPTSVDFTPSGDSLIFTHASGLGVIDLSPQTPTVTEFSLALNPNLGQRPERAVVLGNGKAYVALSGTSSEAAQLLEIDLTTGEQRVRHDAANANGIALAGSIQRSPDRTAFIFNGGPGQFRRYDATTDQFTSGGSALPYPVMFSLDRRGQHNALSLDIYDASLSFVRRVESIWPTGILSIATHISADGEDLYYLGPPGIMRSRVNDGRLIDRMRNPFAAQFIRVASDDSFLVTAGGLTNWALSLIRLR